MYLDRQTGEHLPDHVGVCDRENNCSYSYTAAQYIKEGGFIRPADEFKPIPLPPPKRTDWRCPPEFVAYTHKDIKNNFLVWLEKTIGPNKLAETYRVGTFPKGRNYPQYEGAMVYWQIGEDGLERSGKIIQYGDDGKRVKDLKAMWMHTVVTSQSMEDLGCAQVYFGTHLIKDWHGPVAIVESEKSALICSWFYPQYLWLATGGSNMISVEKSMCLTGRDVTFFPDRGMYDNWSKVVIDLEPLFKSCIVSDILECIGAEDGEDIADYLLPVNVIAAMQIDLFPETQEKVQETLQVSGQVATLASPVDRMLAIPEIDTLFKELDLDRERVTVTSLNE